MKFDEKQRVNHALWTAMTAVFALSLAACDQKPSAEKFGKDIDRAADKAGRQFEQAADTAGKKIDQAASVISEKTAEAGKAIDDAALTAKVKSALVTEPGLKALAINVDTTGGVVTLHGTTDTPANRDKAGQVASGVQGVKSVTNKLEIAKGS